MSETITRAPSAASMRASDSPTWPAPTTATLRPARPVGPEPVLDAGAHGGVHAERRERAGIAEAAEILGQADQVLGPRGDQAHVGRARPDVLGRDVPPAERLDGVAEVQQHRLARLGRELGARLHAHDALAAAQVHAGHGRLEGHPLGEAQRIRHGVGGVRRRWSAGSRRGRGRARSSAPRRSCMRRCARRGAPAAVRGRGRTGPCAFPPRSSESFAMTSFGRRALRFFRRMSEMRPVGLRRAGRRPGERQLRWVGKLGSPAAAVRVHNSHTRPHTGIRACAEMHAHRCITCARADLADPSSVQLCPSRSPPRTPTAPPPSAVDVRRPRARRATRVEPGEPQAEVQGEAVLADLQARARDLLDPLEPVVQRRPVEAERLGGGLDVTGPVQVRLERLDQLFVGAVAQELDQPGMQRVVVEVVREPRERPVDAELVPRGDAPEACDALRDGDGVARLPVGPRVQRRAARRRRSPRA